jgi:hypothetical protein
MDGMNVAKRMATAVDKKNAAMRGSRGERQISIVTAVVHRVVHQREAMTAFCVRYPLASERLRHFSSHPINKSVSPSDMQLVVHWRSEA